MSLDYLSALSPLDGRYRELTLPLSSYFSEAALIQARVRVECVYLSYLAKFGVIRNFSPAEQELLERLPQLTKEQVIRIKELEKTTHHDVKAVEYFVREKINTTSLKDISAFIHFGLTSEDINNLSYRFLLNGALKEVILPSLYSVLSQVVAFSQEYVDTPMLARTHGQPAIPTTLGKEWVVFGMRLLRQIQYLQTYRLTGKLNGAVGGYQAVVFAFPDIDWLSLSKELVESFGFEWIPLTTQINAPDDLVDIFSHIHHLNTILIGFNQDIWRYISDNWIVQKGKEVFVGSSTMPQKINPIEFENSEGNLLMANSILEGFLRKLPISRLQRDLSESTVLRNIGVALGHCLLSYSSFEKGTSQLAANKEVMHDDLHQNYAILAEAWQIVMRKEGDETGYETVATLCKNKMIDKTSWKKATEQADAQLSLMEPEDYLGLTISLAQQCIDEINDFLQKGSYA